MSLLASAGLSAERLRFMAIIGSLTDDEFEFGRTLISWWPGRCSVMSQSTTPTSCADWAVSATFPPM